MKIVETDFSKIPKIHLILKNFYLANGELERKTLGAVSCSDKKNLCTNYKPN